jgi:hypothetical protein
MRAAFHEPAPASELDRRFAGHETRVAVRVDRDRARGGSAVEHGKQVHIADLKPHQRYPAGRGLKPEFLGGARCPLMTRRTPVASIGSCFAAEIKAYLVRKGFNYLHAASDSEGQRHPTAWNRVYNTCSMRQEVERGVSAFAPNERFWDVEDRILDPYRKMVSWKTRAEAEQELEQHRLAVSRIIRKAEVFILTIGLREVWFSKLDGSVFYGVPPVGAYNPELHGFRMTTVEENVRNLDAIHALLMSVNPGCKFIITVSPVPLHATFLEQNVVVSNAISKATLVVAVNEFVSRHDNVFYFPAYEIVTVGIRKAFERDNRHVRRRTVNRIMSIFEQKFVTE